MNKIYKLIWNIVSQSYIAVSEKAKSKVSCKSIATTLLLSIITINGTNAYADVKLADGDKTVVQIVSGSPGAASATGAGSIAIGAGSTINGTIGGDYSSIGIGVSTKVDGKASISMGEEATVNADRSIALGNSSKVTASSSVALGANSVVTAENSVALGNNSIADRKNTVSLGSSTAQRQLVNVKAGTQQNDAATISQLSPIIEGLGGGPQSMQLRVL